MLPLPRIIWHETTTIIQPARRPEPTEAMDDVEQVRSYVEAYRWGGPTSALQLHHLRELSRLIRPGDTVVDLACGPGPLLLELAPLYTDVTFIGADLSRSMLQHLRGEASARGLSNVTVVEEDIRALPSLGAGTVDLVVSTSALHHLPDEEALRQVFRRIRELLRPGGGFYLFDFGLLKSAEARRMFVSEVARLAPPVTAHDYAVSLEAAFPVGIVTAVARDELPRPYTMATSAFVDFCYFLQTPPRADCRPTVHSYVEAVRAGLPAAMRLDHVMLRRLRRRVVVT